MLKYTARIVKETKMKSRYLFYLKEKIKDRKIQMFILFLFISTCIFLCFIAIQRIANYSTEFEENQALVQEYNDNLATFDDEIKKIEESLVTTQEEIDNIQAYLDHSVLMSLDAQKYYVESIQYKLNISENCGQILNLIQTYIKEGGMKELLSHSLENFPGEYMNEFVYTQIKDVYFDIKVLYSSEEGAKQIIKEINLILEDYIQELSQTYGEMTFEICACNSYTEASIDITNTQNARHDSLRAYQTAYADYEQRMINYKTNKANHIKNYEPTIILSERPKASFVVEYLIIGIVAFSILLLLIYTTWYIFDDRIADIKYLSQGIIPIFECKVHSEIEYEKLLLQLINTYYIANNFHRYLYRDIKDNLMNIDSQNNIINQLSASNELSEIIIQFVSGFNISVMKKLAESDGCIIGIQKNKTTYSDLDKVIAEAKNMSIPVLGIICKDE